jgi:hypothetical protein
MSLFMAYLTTLSLADYTATNNVDISAKCNNNTSRGEKESRKN